MPPRKLPPNEVIIAEYRSGLSSTEIAERHGTQPSAVVSALRRAGEPRRSTSEAQKLAFATGRNRPARYWAGKKQPAEMVKRRIAGITGEKHWLWRGGKDRRLYRKVGVKERCEGCGAKANLGVHHRDFDHYNDDPGNLAVMCISCHMSLHKTEYWTARREGRAPRLSNGPVSWDRTKGGEAKDGAVRDGQ